MATGFKGAIKEIPELFRKGKEMGPEDETKGKMQKQRKRKKERAGAALIASKMMMDEVES